MFFYCTYKSIVEKLIKVRYTVSSEIVDCGRVVLQVVTNVSDERNSYIFLRNVSNKQPHNPEDN